MRLVGVASVGLFLVALVVFVGLDELDVRAARSRHLAHTRHIE